MKSNVNTIQNINRVSLPTVLGIIKLEAHKKMVPIKIADISEKMESQSIESISFSESS